MSEQFHQENPMSSQDMKRMRIKEYLAGLEHKDPISVGQTVTVIEGPHAQKALKVKEIRPDGMVSLQASPDVKDIIEYPESELYDMTDFMEAYRHASKSLS